MNDQELAAEARRVGIELCARAGRVAVGGDRDRFAGWLLKELADRLDGRAAALEAVLGFHEEFDGHCSSCCDAYGDDVAWPCAEFRVITAALTPAADESGDDSLPG